MNRQQFLTEIDLAVREWKVATMKQVVTLDMDGTMFDSWACCGKRAPFAGSPECRHLRHDIWAEVRATLARYPEAELVVLSWRAGYEAVTRQWLQDVGIEVSAVYVPGSADTQAIGARNGGQVLFKRNVVRALAARGVQVVASFDDNADVIQALAAEGIETRQVPRMAKVEPWEWTAGYIGAPKPRWEPAAAPRDPYNDVPPATWQEAAALWEQVA